MLATPGPMPCRRCGGGWVWTVADADYRAKHGWPAVPAHCVPCRAVRRALGLNVWRRACVKCQRLFTWDAAEQQVYAEKHLCPPKRCVSCRRPKKGRRHRVGGGEVASLDHVPTGRGSQ